MSFSCFHAPCYKISRAGYFQSALIVKDGLTGSPWGDWALYTDSPLRAFESELGVQAPVGFWDPAGLAALSSPLELRRRRIVEIKHGRVSMLVRILRHIVRRA